MVPIPWSLAFPGDATTSPCSSISATGCGGGCGGCCTSCSGSAGGGALESGVGWEDVAVDRFIWFYSRRSPVVMQLHPGCSSTSINLEEILARFSNVQSKMVWLNFHQLQILQGESTRGPQGGHRQGTGDGEVQRTRRQRRLSIKVLGGARKMVV